MPLSSSQTVAIATGFVLVLWPVYTVFILPRSASLSLLPGPPTVGLFGGHMAHVMLPHLAEKTHEKWVQAYGMNLRFHGLGSFDSRLFTVDPVAVSYILNHPEMFTKPWQTRRFFERLIGPAIFAAEGHDHKRLRKATAPAFTNQSIDALCYIFLDKADQLCDRWEAMFTTPEPARSTTVDVLPWLTRATFDVIGLAGFDYDFNAIEGESNELYLAYRTMHTIALDSPGIGGLLEVYFPWFTGLLPTERNQRIRHAQQVIKQFGTKMVRDRRATDSSEKSFDVRNNGRHAPCGKDILSLLVKANTVGPLSGRISDEELISNISTFMLVGTDSTSLALCWTLHLLSLNQTIQSKLRQEILSSGITPSSPNKSDGRKYTHLELIHIIDSLPYLDKVVKESLRLCPPVHSTIRVASEDVWIPTSASGIRLKGDPEHLIRHEFKITKGSFIHLPIEAVNTTTLVWGPDSLEFNPGRWDNLPDTVHIGMSGVAGLLTFSAGPRICQGTKFALTEFSHHITLLIKAFLARLIPRLIFSPAAPIAKSNIVFMRPYIQNQFSKGAKLPLIVERYDR